MMIQETGLPFLLTLALEFLQDDLNAEGNNYQEDLLAAVLKINPGNWKSNKEIGIAIEKLIKNRLMSYGNSIPVWTLITFMRRSSIKAAKKMRVILPADE